MNAVTVDLDIAVMVEIESAISALRDVQARTRIVGAWAAGNIDAQDAMELLTGLDLIEYPPEFLPELPPKRTPDGLWRVEVWKQLREERDAARRRAGVGRRT